MKVLQMWYYSLRTPWIYPWGGSETRLSIAGAQNKLPVHREGDRILVPEDGSLAATSAILKPASSSWPDLHRNEFYCMALAREIGLKTPSAELLPVGGHLVYLVDRYDRERTAQGVKRIHQEDFCQALGVSRLQKYQENGGPGFAACGDLLLHPLVRADNESREAFVRCAIFNYIIGNCDAHAKNFSLLYEDGRRPQLAPFYDLVSTRAYPELDQKYAMSIGKTWCFDRIADHSWAQFSMDMHIRQERLHGLMADVHTAVSRQMEPLAAQHEQVYGPSPIYDRLLQVVREGLEKVEQVLEPAAGPSPGR